MQEPKASPFFYPHPVILVGTHPGVWGQSPQGVNDEFTRQGDAIADRREAGRAKRGRPEQSEGRTYSKSATCVRSLPSGIDKKRGRHPATEAERGALRRKQFARPKLSNAMFTIHNRNVR
jgi:hypothetical protein